MADEDRLSLAPFYTADAEGLRTKFRQIEHLIGRSHHTGSEGSYCESLLKEFLRRTLPGQLSVDGGFIRRVSEADWSQNNSTLKAEDDIASPQLDIIIHDSQKFAPLVRSEDFVVVLPQAVRGIIEVKKVLDWKALNDAVINITNTLDLLRKWRYTTTRTFSAIFAFGLGDDLAPKTKPMSDSFKNCYQAARGRLGSDCELPHLVMALPRLAIQNSSHPDRFDYCPMCPDDQESPNIAGQFLVYLISHFTAPDQGRAFQYPGHLYDWRKEGFIVPRPERDGKPG